MSQMAMRPTKRRFKIALIFMPLANIRPLLSLTSLPISVGLITDELARRLARSHDVIAYCARGEGRQKVEQFDGVEYRRISTWLDLRLLKSRKIIWFDRRLSKRQKIIRLIDLLGRRNEAQPFVGSAWWYRRFIGKVVADLSRKDCDIVHIVNMSQFVPVIRARLPKTRIVLHMYCQWLEQLDAAMIERRLNAADLVLGVSNSSLQACGDAFPHWHNAAAIFTTARISRSLPGLLASSQSPNSSCLSVGSLLKRASTSCLMLFVWCWRSTRTRISN
jgi:hypothetical protein